MLKVANNTKDQKLTQGIEKMWTKFQVSCCGIVKYLFLGQEKDFKNMYGQ